MNLGFCLWVARRARLGDLVDVVVHEPYLEFSWGPWRHLAMALVHRVMTVVCCGRGPSASGSRRRRGKRGCVRTRWAAPSRCAGCPSPGAKGHAARRHADSRSIAAPWAAAGRPFRLPTATAVAPLLEERLVGVMASASAAGAAAGGHRRARPSRLGSLPIIPDWRRPVHAPGYLPAIALGAHLTACDVLVQPYPDGVTARRTSVMAGLARGCAVVTTTGHLTEPLWAEQGAVALVDVGDAGALYRQRSKAAGDAAARRGRLGARARDGVRRALFSGSPGPHAAGGMNVETSRRRRIAIVSHSRERVGGVESYVATLVPALRRAGHEVGCWFETAGTVAIR